MVTLPPHLMYQTQFTKTGARDMKNKKPFRTKQQKESARQKRFMCDDGVYRSTAKVSYHK